VPTRLKPFQHEILKVVGIKSEQLDEFEGSEPFEFDRLYIAPPIPKTQIDTPEPLQWLRAKCRSFYNVESGNRTRRLFLSRKSDNHYRAVNEDQLEQVLSEFGFERISPGNLTLEDQVRLFSQAEMIVGTGTGLSNMLFAEPGTRILQFQEPGKIVHALWTMSEALGHEYWYLMAVPIPNARHELPDMHVPPDQLRAAVLAILGADRSRWKEPTVN
jgi:capsular polysaccharide biosynthesis protein